MDFYYPIIPDESGDILILVNKTAPLHTNGDVSLSMNVEPDSERPYSKWNLPTAARSTVRSYTKDPYQPEIINASKEKLK